MALCTLAGLGNRSGKKFLRGISFQGSKKWSSPVALKACCSNPNFDRFLKPRASCLEQLARFHTQKWDCHALPLFALDRNIPRLFLVSIFQQTRPKTWAPNPHVGACGNSVGHEHSTQSFRRTTTHTERK